MNIAFWIIALLMAGGVLAVLVPPLLSRRKEAGESGAVINTAIYRDQLRELDADLRAGTLEAGQYDKARAELEGRLLGDVDHAVATPVLAAPGGRGVAVVLGIAVPVAAVLMYLAIGTPAALDPKALTNPHADAQGVQVQQIEAMVEKLAARLKDEPDNAEGWVMLARSYRVLGRFKEAAAAYAAAAGRSKPDPDLLADYADSLGMAQDGNLAGKPEQLVLQALKLDPKHVKSLALAGTAAFERRDFARAAEYWEHILPQLPPDSEMAQAVRSSIAEARAEAKLPPAAAAAKPAAKSVAGAARVAGTVELAPAFAAKAAPGDTVFIFARAVEGPRLPLAILRAQAKSLPLKFTLDDSLAMAPGMNLSSQRRVVVGARISRSGSANPQPGDLEGYSAPVDVGADGVVVRIDREVR